MRTMARSLLELALTPLPRLVANGDRLILAYHNVVASPSDICGDRSLHLTAEHFQQQLDAMCLEADVVPLMELLDCRDRRARLVSITFDDGYATSLDYGVRACAQRKLPCTIFVARDLAGSIPYWDVCAHAGHWSTTDRETFLSEQRGRATHSPGDEAGALSTARIATISEWLEASALPGVTIGNHCATHPNLSALTEAEAVAELTANHRWLEQTFSDRAVIPVAAYPYGKAPIRAERVLAASGMYAGLLVEGGWMRLGMAQDNAILPRWNVPSGISRMGFMLRLRGRLF
jgi:peptidoglycan/xylan/chitin deacetylase (PgdA/CDA1 family)